MLKKNHLPVIVPEQIQGTVRHQFEGGFLNSVLAFFYSSALNFAFLFARARTVSDI